MEKRTRLVDCNVREAGDRTLTFTASTEEVARDGDIVLAKAWDVENFKANPVILWSHNPEEPPIGRATAVRKVTRGDGPKRLEIDVEFAGFEQMHEKAEQIYLLYRDGFLKAVSVGFYPLERKELSDKDREKYGLDRFGSVWTKAELLEVSAVGVPADTGALIQAAAENENVREAVVAMRGVSDEWDDVAQTVTASSHDDEEELSDLDALRADIQTVSDAVTLIGEQVSELHRALKRRKSKSTARQPAEHSEDDLYGIAEAIDKLKGGSK